MHKKARYETRFLSNETWRVHYCDIPREVFKPLICASASACILTHNHPSGDPTPSDSDIKVTRDLVRAGQLLKLDVLDHVIIGNKAENPNGYASLREQGYFY